MDSKVYVDEIIQSFANDGNVFLRLGAVTGDVDISGKDIKNIATTLVIPLCRFSEFAKNVGIAAQLYAEPQTSELSNFQQTDSKIVEYEAGTPLLVPD